MTTEEEFEFLRRLDTQHLLFETYLCAVAGKFGISISEAGEVIGKYLNDGQSYEESRDVQ